MIKLKFISNGGNNLFIDNISIAHPDVLNYSDIEKSIQLYPNPATNRLKINGHQYIESMTFLDLQGRVIDEIPQPAENINIDRLVKGTYLISLKLINEERVVKKLTVN